MLDIAAIERFVDRKMLFNRGRFRNTCNVILRITTIDIFYLF